MESRIKFRIENYLLFAGVAVDQIYGVRSQNQFQGSTKLSILYRVLTGQNQRRKHEIHSMLFNDIHCFVSYISYIYGPKNCLWPLKAKIPLFSRENTTHNFLFNTPWIYNSCWLAPGKYSNSQIHPSRDGPSVWGSMCRLRVFCELRWPSDTLSTTASGLTLKKMDQPSLKIFPLKTVGEKKCIEPIEDKSCESGCW